MIPLQFITSLLPKIVTNKWFIIVIGILLIIIAGFFINIRAYNKGYKTGVEVTKAKYNKEKLEWFAKTTELQRDHENTVNGLMTSYNGKISEYEDTIAQLEIDKSILNMDLENAINKPPVVKTRYIHKYVPVETNCTISKGFVELHNTAAQGKQLVENPIDAELPSNVTLQDVGAIVAINYYEYNKLVSKLKTLQQIVQDFQNKQQELLK